jgi:hypothetical protein
LPIHGLSRAASKPSLFDRRLFASDPRGRLRFRLRSPPPQRKARREGQEFNGVALVHAVFEHNDWFFSGWSFTEFPNEPCKALSDPSWEPPGPMEWNQPMEELRSPVGVPSHIDKK